MAPKDGPLKKPQTLGGVVYLLVLGSAGVGLVLVFLGAWRTGLSWIGVGLVVAGLTRLVLTDRGAGMLRVRRRWSDVLMLVLAGVGLVVLSIVVPNQPPA